MTTVCVCVCSARCLCGVCAHKCTPVPLSVVYTVQPQKGQHVPHKNAVGWCVTCVHVFWCGYRSPLTKQAKGSPCSVS